MSGRFAGPTQSVPCSLYTAFFLCPGDKAAAACDSLIVWHNRNEEMLQELKISHSTCMKGLVCRTCAGTRVVKQIRHEKK